MVMAKIFQVVGYAGIHDLLCCLGDPSFPLSSTVDISDTPQMFWPAFTGYAIRERNFEHAAFFLWKHAAYGIYISVPAEYLVSNL